MTESPSFSSSLLNDVRAILQEARGKAYAAANAAMVDAYWRIGRRIVEEEQGGAARAEYGSQLIRHLACALGEEFGRGMSVANLKNFRQFYLTFPDADKSYAVRSELSWTHWRLIMRVEDSQARDYYIGETARQGWSSRVLARAIETRSYQRFLQTPESDLPAHQKPNPQSRQGKNNAQTLLGVIKIPSTPQIRNILDKISAQTLFVVFAWVYQALQKGGYLKPFQSLENHLLVTLDGTQYYSSSTLHCQKCSIRTHNTGAVTYFHGAIVPVIVAPGVCEVISLAPEFITPQDGHQKQDCEIAAANRWVTAHACDFIEQKVTLLGDDLYSHQPMCEHALDAGMNFIFTCLPDSHAALYEWLNYLDGIGEVHTLESRQCNKRVQEIYRYRFVNKIPLRDTQPALEVNWCELTITRESDAKEL
jgi:hypothetical protein